MRQYTVDIIFIDSRKCEDVDQVMRPNLFIGENHRLNED